jgi:hypothetical protein
MSADPGHRHDLLSSGQAKVLPSAVAFSQKKSIVRSVFRQRPDASLERPWLAERAARPERRRRHAIARTLGITFQLTLLSRADEVIE